MPSRLTVRGRGELGQMDCRILPEPPAAGDCAADAAIYRRLAGGLSDAAQDVS